MPLSWLSFLTHLGFGLGLFIIALIITQAMIKRVRIMDVPNERSSHRAPVPKSGGIAIVTTFLIGIVAIYLLGDKTPITKGYFVGFIVSSLAIALVSFYDDINYKFFTVKLGTQLVAAVLVLCFGIVIDEIGIPGYGLAHVGWIAYPLSLLWIVGLTNAFNFMDGLDGLAAGVAVIVSFFLGYITLVNGSTFVYITCYAIFAGALGFLRYNIPPAKIFMGDVGSAFLGFVFATLAIISARYDHSHTSFFVVPLLLFHFIFDTSFTFVRRLMSKEYVTQAHRTHLYQLLNQLGWSHLRVSLFQYAMCLAQGIGAVYMVHVKGDQRLFVFIPFLIFQICYAVVVVRKAKREGILNG